MHNCDKKNGNYAMICNELCLSNYQCITKIQYVAYIALGFACGPGFQRTAAERSQNVGAGEDEGNEMWREKHQAFLFD